MVGFPVLVHVGDEAPVDAVRDGLVVSVDSVGWEEHDQVIERLIVLCAEVEDTQVGLGLDE